MDNWKNNEFLKLERSEQKALVEVVIFASDEATNIEMLNKIFNLIGDKIESSEAEAQEENNLDENNTDREDNLDEKNSEEQSGYINNSKQNDSIFVEIIDEINQDLEKSGRPFRIIKNAGAFLYASNPEYGELLQRISKYKVKKRFSQAALETLAIIAYRQPISKPEIEQIRGVNSNEIVNSLNEKGMIEITGRRDMIGKPLLYGTTTNFLKAFGINSIDELPRLREIDEIMDKQDKDSNQGILLNIVNNEMSPDRTFEIPEYTEAIEKEITDEQ